METLEEKRRQEIISERIVPEGRLNELVPLESERRGFLTQLREDEKKIKLLETAVKYAEEEREKEKKRADEFERLYFELLHRYERSTTEREKELEEIIKEKDEKIASRDAKIASKKKEITALHKKCGNYRQEMNKKRIEAENKNKQLLETRTRLEMTETCRKIEGLANYQKIKEYEEVIQSAQNSAI